MSVPAIALEQGHQAATSSANPPKKRRIPKRIGEVVHLLVTGECKDIKSAAEQVGMHPNYVYGALKKPEIIAFMEQQTRVALARLQAPAAGMYAKLMAEASSENVRKDLIMHALAMQGHKPRADAQVSVNIDIKAGYVIDLTDKQSDDMQTVIDARLTQHGDK